ncbi:signal peptidase I [Streptomyces sp. SAS_270]|uniref:signal peptidase I n=1 Tax=Streptomyces sp. SAS_270 TaxID=3412748 RepID=UPI00403C45EA
MRRVRGLAVTAWLLGPLGLVMVVGSLLYVRSVYTSVTVAGGSMAPTYTVGKRLVVERLDGDEVRRGDVVLFEAPEPEIKGALIKRVIGVGGDRVVCCEGSGADERVTVNGKPLDEPYLKDGVADGVRPYDVKVPAGRLFLLGDYRANSMDSRFYTSVGHQGTVADGAVLGRVVDGFGGALVWISAALVGLVLALVGLGFGIAALVVRRRQVVPPMPPWPVQV